MIIIGLDWWLCSPTLSTRKKMTLLELQLLSIFESSVLNQLKRKWIESINGVLEHYLLSSLQDTWISEVWPYVPYKLEKILIIFSLGPMSFQLFFHCIFSCSNSTFQSHSVSPFSLPAGLSCVFLRRFSYVEPSMVRYQYYSLRCSFFHKITWVGFLLIETWILDRWII